MYMNCFCAFSIFSFLVLTVCHEMVCIDPRELGAISGNPGGVSGDFWETNTIAIQTAIDRASSSSDGISCVSIAGGDYVTADLFLKSNIIFRIESDSRLLLAVNQTLSALITIENATNIVIEGGGVIYGNAEYYYEYYDDYDDRFQPVEWRPDRLVYLLTSSNLVIRNVKIQNSSNWNLHIRGCINVTVDNVSVYGDWRYPNNDGIDPDSSIDVTIMNSDVNVADDGICPKATEGYGPLRNLIVKNCTVRSKSHALKFGSLCDTEMSDILFEDITIWDSNAGISIQQRSQGDIHNVTYRNINVETRYVAPRWWGNGEWLVVTAEKRHEDDVIGGVFDLVFENINARSENGGLISGKNNGVFNVTMSNVSVTIDAWSNYSLDGGPMCQRMTKELQPNNDIDCRGAQDHRPSYTEVSKSYMASLLF